ncbi:MAG: hypothetical protein R3E32_16820 [Chitinophagales bacterium]
MFDTEPFFSIFPSIPNQNIQSTMLKSTYITSFLMTIFFLLTIACQTNTSHEVETSTQATASTFKNPAAPDFNMAESDEKAIEVADEVMAAMGGRANWDAIHFLKWNFFGRRTLLWDKKTGNVRIEIPEDSLKLLVNVQTKEGKATQKGNVVSDPTVLKELMRKAYETWVNDSYWLVMPFKLKDSGVTLKYKGTGITEDEKEASILQLTFNEVGVTPENKYLVYIDKSSNLVSQWAFYQKASDDSARFTTPWKDYQPYGNILLSGDRGKNKLSDIAVFEELPKGVFENFEVEIP